jgi:flagellar hook-associated protein 1
MSSIGSILNTAKQAFMTQQVAIEVTGTNVSNASSVGYSKQRAIIVPVNSAEVAQNDIQGGVTVETVQRLYDQFIERQISEQSSQLNYSEARHSALQQVEAIFNESQKDGLSSAMDRFWKAWDDLSVNPNGDVERMAVLSAADNLAATFRDYAGQLIDMQGTLNTRIAGTVEQLNSYLAEIATLNEKIIQTQSGGDNVNSLLDSRSELLKKISEQVDIDYIQQSDGSLAIFLSNGKALVQGAMSWPLDAVRNPATGFYDVVFENDPVTSLNGVITGGTLGAYLAVRDSDVEEYLDQLNTLASTLVDRVNSQHADGFDKYGSVGGLFFVDVTEARDMAVNAAVTADRGLIAASATVSSDGDNARLMGTLKDALSMNSATTTFGAYVGSLIGQIGTDVNMSKQSYDQRNAVMLTLNSQKEQMSGVSIDEEMINMIKYQTGYNAAGKLITTTQELLDTLLGLIE